jgi:hypothetical protein
MSNDDIIFLISLVANFVFLLYIIWLRLDNQHMSDLLVAQYMKNAEDEKAD